MHQATKWYIANDTTCLSWFLVTAPLISLAKAMSLCATYTAIYR